MLKMRDKLKYIVIIYNLSVNYLPIDVTVEGIVIQRRDEGTTIPAP